MRAVDPGAPALVRSVAIGCMIAIAPIGLHSQAPDSSTAPTDTVARPIDGSLPNGRIIQRLLSGADSSQRYALYLPSSFVRERQWPVLFLLDPRGRALIPMQRFQPAAEHLGYIVISSYNTLSDGPIQPNYSAMNAMLDDVQQFLPADSRRLYLARFSGTARFAWQMSTQAPGTIAAIIGTGASVPGGRSWIRSNIGRTSPAPFGTIGTLDPNYEEVRELDAELDAIGTAHHIERSMAAISSLRSISTVLRADARVRRAEAAEAAVAERDARLVEALFAFVADLKRAPSPPSVDDARKRLDLDRLRRDAARTDDSTSAIASRRALERIFSQLSFYAPRELLDARRYAHAAAALRVARLIKPDDRFACLTHARALAQTGDRMNALQALECAAASRQLTARTIEGDALLEPLRGEARYQAVVRQLTPER